MNKQKIILSLVIFSLMGCSSTKKNIVVIPQYNTTVVENIPSLQEDFNRKAGNKVFFAFDSSNLSNEAENTLRKQVTWLKDNPSVLVSIEGHCDEIGTAKYNSALGLRRAKAVNNFLIKHGIDKNRLSVISYGKDRPEYLEHTTEAQKLNRRSVTIIVSE